MKMDKSIIFLIAFLGLSSEIFSGNEKKMSQ